MPVELNISLSPQMARFIRAKVKNGEYASASDVVSDALRHLRGAEAAKRERRLAGFDSHLSKAQQEGIRRGVEAGIKDIDEGRYEQYDAPDLRNLAKELVGASAKKLAGASKTR
jgi:putative addiction module CopG family antidote